jgi:hypothetical protein
MPYILNKTNGAKLATLDDASLDLTTNLTLVGRNYSGYGETVNENFIKLLENFSNTTAPSRPLQGQLWFDNSTDNRRLYVCYDGKNFKGVATLRVQSTSPDSSTEGELWWNNSDNQLYAFDGSSYLLIGPQTSSSAKSSWAFDEEIDADDTGNYSNPIIKGKVGSDVILTVSKLSNPVSRTEGVFLKPKSTSVDIYGTSKFSNGIRRGITLVGCNAVGSSKENGYYFWGTASDALRSTTATNVTVASTNSNSTFYVPFVSTSTGDASVKSTSTFTYNPSTGVVNATATAARYADLAERYEADAVYDEGTVLVIGGEKEVTVTSIFADTRVAGIVSKNPAHLMNSEAGTDETHPAIALKGRVPCKVLGYIKKGDLIVTSSTPGYGCAASSVFGGSVIGKALGSQSEGYGVIEVLVV